MSNKFVEVCVPLPVFKTFHYKIPSDLKGEVHPGSRILVEFKKKKVLGYVLSRLDTSPIHPTKPIIEIASTEPLFSPQMLEFFKWLSSYYVTPLGEVIKTALPLLNSPVSKRRPSEIPKGLPSGASIQTLTTDQINILETLDQALLKNTFSPFLLHGVTGSGKTEVYIRIIKKALGLGKKVIVIVPEISLTPQLIGRFEAHFPNKLAILHSKLTPGQRKLQWTKIKNEEVDIAIGARSAIFAPFKHIGIIVVDEEHDSSFKQEEKFRYHGRDVALVRGQLENALVILGSATPSIESYYHAYLGNRNRKYQLLQLPKRVLDRPLPSIECIDLKQSNSTFGQTFIFSSELLSAIEKTISLKEQTLLFLNRRGFAPFILCQECGFSYRCPHCSVALTVYSQVQKLICHYCSHTIIIPKSCPDCHGSRLLSTGLGTEKVQSALQALFPGVVIDRMDKTTTQKRDSLSGILSRFSDGKTQVLIGTQMIAKGHDFPNVTLVGVILSDISLNIPDFRAPERTFQLLTQVSGRAGRGEKEGRVLIQTFNPNHYSLKHARTHDVHGFMEEELSYRKELSYPPYSRLIHIKVSHANETKAKQKIRRVWEILKTLQKECSELQKITVLGPAPAPLSRIKNKFRYHLLLKSPSTRLSKDLWTALLKYEADLFSSPKIQIDVDPLNLL